jgi:hypothetical protein
MKVKTFSIIVTMIFLLALIAIIQLPLHVRPDPSPVAATAEPDENYTPSMTPEILPDMAMPEVNETSVNVTPVTLSENSNNIVKLVMTPTPAPMSQTPTPEPRSTPMAPMEPMEPWKPAVPMTSW